MTRPDRLLPGDPLPWVVARTSRHPRLPLDTLAGRYLVMTFVRGGDPPFPEAVGFGRELRQRGARWLLVAGTPTPALDALAVPPHHWLLLDTDAAIRTRYGIDAYGTGTVSLLLSPRLHVAAIVAEPDPAGHAAQLLERLAVQAPLAELRRALGPPPILIIPGVFEPELCRMLIEGYRQHGGEPSGFMRDEKGKTVLKFDPSFKVRRDWEITDPKLMEAIGARFQRRVVPEIRRAYNYTVTHLERQIVACYEAADGGHFAAHRDNTARGVVHRRFACTLNLNRDYEGGDLRFPEFGPETYAAPAGGCVIFSCALLHQACRVVAGTRYAFLPFLHDAQAEKIRRETAHLVDLGSPTAADGDSVGARG